MAAQYGGKVYNSFYELVDKVKIKSILSIRSIYCHSG